MGFNEAEASLPRNGFFGVTGMAQALRFNEAEASLPRNGHAPRAERRVQRHRFNEAEASLPRNGAPYREWEKDKHLGFNEAEASLPRNGPLRMGFDGYRTRASMRPRQACLGMGEKGVLYKAGPRASMRPRQACLGMNQERRPVPARFAVASMRPRQACLGMARRASINASLTSGFNEAEASLPRNAGGLTGPPRVTLPCFNEAEASLPRNAPMRESMRSAVINASMRPRQACLGMTGHRLLSGHA